MKQYTTEFKEQILAECQEVGNIALVARPHQICENTIYTWMKRKRKNGSLKPLPKGEKQHLEELEKRLKAVSTENDRLKRLLAEKELELAALQGTEG